MGESTINLPPGSGDLSLYICITTHQYTIPSFIFNKMQASHSGAVDGDLYFAEVQIPTFPHLNLYMW